MVINGIKLTFCTRCTLSNSSKIKRSTGVSRKKNTCKFHTIKYLIILQHYLCTFYGDLKSYILICYKYTTHMSQPSVVTYLHETLNQGFTALSTNHLNILPATMLFSVAFFRHHGNLRLDILK